MFRNVTLPSIRQALPYGVLLCNVPATGEFGAVAVVSGKIRSQTATMPIMIEMLYNERLSVPAFQMAAGLTLKTALERRYADQLAASGRHQEDPPMHIEIDGIAKEPGQTAALQPVSLSVPSGALIALLGPSGSGKTTLLRILGGWRSRPRAGSPSTAWTPCRCACRTAARASCSSTTPSSAT